MTIEKEMTSRNGVDSRPLFSRRGITEGYRDHSFTCRFHHNIDGVDGAADAEACTSPQSEL
jgi:hypothetical protein